MRRVHLVLSHLLLATAALMAGPVSAEVDVPEVAEVASPPEDPCFDRLTSGAPLAERTCSDTVAALESLTTRSPADVTALVSAYNNRAVARTRSGDLEGAADDLSAAMALAPESWPLYLNRGNLMLARRQPQEAIEDYEAARRMTAQPLPEALLNSALAHRMMGDPVGAERLVRAWAQDRGTRTRPASE